MAGDENAAITLADRQRRGPVGMGRTMAHGSLAGPCASEAPNQRAQLLCRSVANKGHNRPDRLPSPVAVP
jgi:hypothetical protein